MTRGHTDSNGSPRFTRPSTGRFPPRPVLLSESFCATCARCACAPSPSPLGPPLALGACLPRFLHAKQQFRFLAWRIMLGIAFLCGRLSQPARSKWQKATEFGNHPVFRANFSREGERGLACNLVLCAASVFGACKARLRASEFDAFLPSEASSDDRHRIWRRKIEADGSSVAVQVVRAVCARRRIRTARVLFGEALHAFRVRASVSRETSVPLSILRRNRALLGRLTILVSNRL